MTIIHPLKTTKPMKRIRTIWLTSIFLFVFISTHFGQTVDLSLAHKWANIGRDLELGAEISYKKNVLLLGMTYFQNTVLEPHSELYKGSFKGDAVGNKLGAALGYMRAIQWEESNLEFYIKYEINVHKLSHYRYALHEGRPSKIDDKWIVQHFIGGIGKVKILKNLYVQGGASVGIALIESNQPILDNFFGNHTDYEFGGLYELGLAYRLMK